MCFENAKGDREVGKRDQLNKCTDVSRMGVMRFGGDHMITLSHIDLSGQHAGVLKQIVSAASMLGFYVSAYAAQHQHTG